MPGFRMLPAVLTAVCAAVLSACAGAPPPETRSVAEGERICREILEPPSNVLRRVCMTEAEWREYDRSRQRGVREFFRGVGDRPVTQ